jgi:hypothetical protein
MRLFQTFAKKMLILRRTVQYSYGLKKKHRILVLFSSAKLGL